MLRARQKALEEEINAYQKELLSYDIRGDLLIARRDLQSRRILESQELFEGRQKLANDYRKQEAEREIREARQQVAEVHPSLRVLAEETDSQTGEHTRVRGELETIKSEKQEIEALLSKMRRDFQRISERIKAAGHTDVTSLMLRRQREELARPSALRRKLRELKEKISQVQLDLMEMEDLFSRSARIDEKLNQIMVGLGPEIDAAERRSIEFRGRQLLKDERENLGELIDDYDSYFTQLVDLEGTVRTLLNKTGEYTDYVNSQILWIRSSEALQRSDAPKVLAAVRWSADGEKWKGLMRSALDTLAARPISLILLLGLPAGLSVLRFRRPAWLVDAPETEPAASAPLMSLLKSLLNTLLFAALWPTVLWFASWLAIPDSIYRDADVALARETILKVCRELPKVQPDPAPSVILMGFGSPTLNFELRVFILRADYGKVLDSLNTAIEQDLKKWGISLADTKPLG